MKYLKNLPAGFAIFLLLLAPLKAGESFRDRRRGRFGRTGAYEKNNPEVKAAFREAVAAARAATVRILCDGKPVALGTVVERGGTIVTKASVLKGKITCRLGNGREEEGEVIGVDEKNDLALLKANTGILDPLPWRAGGTPEVGSWVATVGEGESPIAIGIISAEPQRIFGSIRPPRERGRLGIWLEERNPGPRISRIEEGSGAEKAGLEVGDIILKVNGGVMKSVQQVVETIGNHRSGSEIRLVLKRGENELKISARLGSLPAEEQRGPASEDRWGGGPFSERRYGFPLALIHDTVIEPDDCGGPIVDLDGKVAGINIARALRVATYALPPEVVQTVVADLKAPSSLSFNPVPRHLIAAGIEGSLLIFGGNHLPDGLAVKFLDLAGGEKARVVVLALTTGGGKIDADRLLHPWNQLKLASLDLLQAHSLEVARIPDFSDLMKAATAVWLTGDDPLQFSRLLEGTPLKRDLQAVLHRGGVVGGAAAGASILSRLAVSSGESGGEPVKGFDLLPGSVIEPRFREGKKELLAETVQKNSDLVGFGIEEGAALLVEGRRIQVAGEGGVAVCLAGSGARTAKMLTWNSGSLGDLTALRRSAIARSGPAFPPAEPGVPHVEKGSLVIAGGGRLPPEVVRRFVELAGGPESPIVVLPTARADPIPERPGDVLMLQRAGARNIKVLRGRTLSEVEAPEFLETLRKARGIWFGGGRQWRFVDAYLDTRAHELFREVLRRGGVIGGSSAGASIQAEYLARGSPLGNRQIMAEGYERGLGFLGGAAIDQHFSQRGRLPDMTSLVKTYPQLLGIGIDESTALIVQGHVAEVMGRHRVCFYDARKPAKSGAPDYEALTAGGLYDLKARKIIKKPKKRMRV